MRKIVAGTIVLIAVALLPFAGVTVAQEGYEIDWWTVDGGGYALSTGDGYVLGGSAGQPDAGLLTGETYLLSGGFWGGAPAIARYRVYLPVVLRGSP
jgi:hypothetical protein